jgi:transposase
MLAPMQAAPTVFSQITSALYPAEFSRCVEAFPTARPTRGLTEYDQFLALCFGQLTYRESLRDIVACLHAKQSLQYHLGFRGHLSRTNLAYANRYRDWRLFEAVAQILMRRAARLYQDEPTQAALPKGIFALDSSIIALSLSLFPWGYYARSRQAALKLHLMLSLQGSLPAWAALTDADFSDCKILDQIPAVCGAYYVLDRGYLDFIRLFRLAQAGAYFVVRNKHQIRFRVLHSARVDKTTGLRCDQTIRLTSPWSLKSYPQPLRRIGFYEAEHQTHFTFLTNQFDVPAWVITQLYRQRWQVELFFKWIKQHLRLRHFYGRSENAVRCQLWSAIGAYLLVAIVKKRLNLRKNLNEILQIVSVNIFEQVPLEELLASASANPRSQIVDHDSQKLFQFND